MPNAEERSAKRKAGRRAAKDAGSATRGVRRAARDARMSRTSEPILKDSKELAQGRSGAISNCGLKHVMLLHAKPFRII